MATLNDLKKQLKQVGAKVTGTKSQLEERLKLWSEYDLGKILIRGNVIQAQTNFEFPTEGFQPVANVIKHCMKWSAIDSWFTERNAKKGLKNGRILAMKRFVKCTCARVEGSLIYIKSFCAAQQHKSKDYAVQLLIAGQVIEIWQANCSCPVGKGWSASCKHIAAVCFSLEHLTVTGQLQEYISCTSTEMNWNKPITGRNIKCYSIFDITNKIKPRIEVSERKTTDTLNALINAGMSCPLLESRRINSTGYLHDRGFYTENYCANYIFSINSININERSVIEESTRMQSKSKLWIDLRMSRTISSIIGECMRTVRSGKFAPGPALKNIIYNKKLKYCKSVKWGIDNENLARAKYEEIMNIKLNKSGIWIHHSNNFLASSPDGISFSENVVIEIKCPYSIRNKSPLEAEYLVKRNNVFSLKSNHPYYAQCQMHMYVTHIDMCDFVIWTTKGIYIEHIPQNTAFIYIIWCNRQLYIMIKFSLAYMYRIL